MKAADGRNFVIRKGFYTKVKGDFVGVYLSPEGPRLFINKEVYDLQSTCWDVEMAMGKTYHVVNFYWRGEVKLSLRSESDQNVFMALYDYLSCRAQEMRLV